MRKFLSTVTWLFSTLLGVFLVVFAPYSWGCTETTQFLSGISPIPNSDKFLVVYDNGADIQLWNPTGEYPERHLDPIAMHGGAVLDVVFSADGQRIYSTSQDYIYRVWDATTGKLLDSFTEPYYQGNVARFSPDGKYLLTNNYPNVVRLWDMASKQVIQTLNTTAYNFAFLTGGEQVVTYDPSDITKNYLNIWDMTTGQPIRGGQDVHLPNNIMLTSYGLVLTQNYQRNETGWLDLTTGNITPIAPIIRNTHTIDSTSDGHYFYYIDDTWQAHLVDTVAQQDHILASHLSNHNMFQSKFIDDTHLIMMDRDTIELWDVRSAQLSHSFRPQKLFYSYPHMVGALSPTKDRLAVGSSNGLIGLWDLSTGEELPTFQNYTDYIHALDVSLNGQFILTTSGSGIRLWDLPTSRLLQTYVGSSWDGRSIIAPNLEWVITTTSQWITFWNLRMGYPIKKIAIAPTTFQPSVAMSPNSQQWAMEQGQEVLLRDTQTNRILARFPSNNVFSLEYSADGQQLLILANGEVNVWDTTTYQRITSIRNAGSKSTLSPDGRYVLTFSSSYYLDRHAVLWDATTGQQLGNFGQGLKIFDFAFSPDGKQILTITGRNTVVLWDTATLRLIRSMCPRMVNNTGQAVGLGLCVAAIMALALNIWCVRQPA